MHLTNCTSLGKNNNQKIVFNNPTNNLLSKYTMPFTLTTISLTQGCFVSSLVEIDRDHYIQISSHSYFNFLSNFTYIAKCVIILWKIWHVLVRYSETDKYVIYAYNISNLYHQTIGLKATIISFFLKFIPFIFQLINTVYCNISSYIYE